MANSLLVQTYFNPDEYWQTLEVAHRIPFGYGHLTWEWKKGLRSYLHPLLFALLYKVLALLHLDSPWFMMKAPCLLQSILSAVGDLYLYKLSQVLFDEFVAQWATKVHFFGGDSYWGLGALSYVFIGSFDGFSVMLFTFLPFSIAGIILSKRWKLLGLFVWVLGLYSVLGHKEFRFVLPVLPVALMFSGYSLAKIRRPDSSDGGRKGSAKNIQTKCSSKMQLAIFFLLATNLPMAFYMSLVHQIMQSHYREKFITEKSVFFVSLFWLILTFEYTGQRGTEDVMNYLSNEALNGRVGSILFLTPCHATPYYSTLHHNLPMHFLDCSPSEEKGMPDESDRFMMDPAGFASEFAKNWTLPSHIVLFDSEEKLLKDFLGLHSFQEIRRFFHAHFKVDRDLQASVVVYALKSQ
ncbi:hypothetical protein F0562_009225 [Nyssa sinensis]|uniref:Mannosyltransferase n=1 Tax=Nyssa sinensis TaxID=561372 RepID=A0A5J4ZZD2_9ASTE|nr:hypothetical protein F0562_009225 [Nyssa sinensis]